MLLSVSQNIGITFMVYGRFLIFDRFSGNVAELGRSQQYANLRVRDVYD